MKYILSMVILLSFNACGPSQQSIEAYDIPQDIQQQLMTIRFDSNFNIIKKPVCYVASNSNTVCYHWNSEMTGNRLKGELRIDTSGVRFQPGMKSFNVNLIVSHMCCGGGHTPKHCANSRKGMMDTSAKYQCSFWSAAILSD